MSEAEVIGQAFVAARLGGRALPDYPGAMPQTLDAAYAIQDAAIAAMARPIAGWKVGRIQPAHEAQYGAQRLAGPIFADRIVHGDEAAMTIFAGGFGAVEAEFLFRLGAVDPARRDYGLEDALDLVEAVHVGIEIASSPYPGINAGGPAVTVSDFGNNNGLIVGAAIPDWRARGLDGWPVETLVDGTSIGTGRAANFPDGLAGSVRFLLELLARRGLPASGMWVSTGAVTGVHEAEAGQAWEARFGADYAVRCSIAAEEPRG